MQYFGKFPKVWYSFDDVASNEIATDITFPVQILQPFAADSKYYYTMVIKDGLKPEDVAYIVYGDATKHWIVLIFNQIIDPLFQWPLSSTNLQNYIAAKYGNIGVAQATVKNYYKIIKRVSSTSDVPDIKQVEIGAAEYANVAIDLAGTTMQLQNGETVTTYTDRATLSMYDYELSLNDSRREITLIQKAYIDNIITSFNKLTAKN